MATIKITYDGKRALTTSQAAQRYGMTPITMRKILSRIDVEPFPESLDARTPLYPATDLDRAMRARPGSGARPRRTERNPS